MKSNRGKLCKLLTEKEVTQALNFVGNFVKKTEKYLSVRKGKLLSVKRYKNLEGKTRMLWMCDCGEYTDTELHVEHKNNTCGCDIRRIDSEIRENFSHKIKEYYEGSEYCNYCSSFRDTLTNRQCNHRVCEICDYIISNKLQVGDTFETLMENWNPADEVYIEAKRLPYFSGNVNKGFVIEGYTLIDTEWYETCSKLLWIKAKHYIKCSLSKDNMERLGKVTRKGETLQYIFLHRFVLGLGNQVKDILGDHISGDRLDNRLCNLRMASIVENSNNNKLPSDNTTGYVGVFFDSSKPETTKRYRAKVHRSGRDVSRFFNSYEDAARGYDKILRVMFPSEFNRYNFPLGDELGVRD
jgi:hypothetical protein